MENKPVSYSKSRTSHPTLVGSLFFILFNLILLSMLSWVLLEGWFSVKIILLYNTNSSFAIQKILSDNLILVNQYHFEYINRTFNLFHQIKNSTQSFVSDYIDRNSMEVFFNVLEITLTRACLFIELIPFMLVILCIFIIDGLVLRDKRKFQGARESTFSFHRLKLLARLSFFLLFFIYMVSPCTILPIFFLIPMVTLSSLFTMLSIKSFKKYL